jgi:hypothetical protein
MDDDGVLSQKARDAMRRGVLPRRSPDRMWGGPGSGARCAVCSQPITPDEVGYEVEFHDRSGQPERTESMHVVCFAAWDRERDAAAPDIHAGCNREGADGRHLPLQASGGTIVGRERDPDRQGTSK